jgi:hypothetical protein
MPPTVTGPIRENQINNSLYVGEAGVRTIQQAVSFSAANGGGYVVVIPYAYAGAETIASIVNGAGTLLRDERNAQVQNYQWNGTKFVPSDLVQLSGFVSKGLAIQTVDVGATIVEFDPTGANGDGRGDFIVQAVPGKPMPAIQLTGRPGDGTPVHAFFRGDKDPVSGNLHVQMPQALELTNLDGNINLWTGQPYEQAGSKGMTVQAKPTENAIDLQGQTVGGANDQKIRLNPAGGSVETGGNLNVTGSIFIAPGSLSVAGQAAIAGDLGADTAHFNNAQALLLWMGDRYGTGAKGMMISTTSAENAVDLQGQTVGGANDQRLRLNVGGGSVETGGSLISNGGIQARAGLSVTGDAAITGNLSANSALFNSCEVGASPVRTFANTADGPGEGMVWPTDGIPVSLGNSWKNPSIDPATLATYPAAGIPVSTGTAWGTPIAPATLATYPAAGIPVSTGTAWGTPIAPATLATYPAAGLAVSTGTAWGAPINPADVPRLSTTNTFAAALTAASVASTGSITAAGDITASHALIARDFTDLLVGTSGITIGMGSDRTSPEINFFNAAAPTFQRRMVIAQWADRCLFINQDDTGNPWTWFEGIRSGVQPIETNFTGNLNATGAKNFRITNPINENEWLTHSSLEGPEIAVFYRGEGVTVDGKETITLPDYFEALTAEEGRTVMLTQIMEAEDEEFSMLMASRVADGRFVVRSAAPTTKFYWEVKAVRTASVKPLQVITPKPTTLPISR